MKLASQFNGAGTINWIFLFSQFPDGIEKHNPPLAEAGSIVARGFSSIEHISSSALLSYQQYPEGIALLPFRPERAKAKTNIC